MEGRTKRTQTPVDYRALVNFKLPKVNKKSLPKTSDSDLYPIRIVEQTESQARVRYIGYDERRDKSELETIDAVRETENREEATVEAPLQPFSLYRELTIKILKALNMW